MSAKSQPAASLQSAPERCPSHRSGVAFYRGRYSDWRALRGTDTPYPVGRKPHNCADASYLADVWASRSFRERKITERWQRSIGQVIARLDRVLASTPMAGQGVYFERYGRQYGVSPYFMVATAATESSIGRAGCGPGGYNAWGLGNCGSAWSVPAFGSWAEAIAYYAKFLTRWDGHSTPYSFHGYAACDECWGRKVSEWMGRLFRVPAVTRYP